MDSSTATPATGQEERMLTAHFSLEELTRSGTAIRLGIDNQPPEEAVVRMQALCEHVLEPLRQRYGRIIVTSGYRSDALNKAVGGVATSQHRLGEAADIYVASREKARKYAMFILAHTDFDQLIMEPRGGKVVRWLHVSYTLRRRNRHQTLY